MTTRPLLRAVTILAGTLLVGLVLFLVAWSCGKPGPLTSRIAYSPLEPATLARMRLRLHLQSAFDLTGDERERVQVAVAE